jgi:hypothetical protein
MKPFSARLKCAIAVQNSVYVSCSATMYNINLYGAMSLPNCQICMATEICMAFCMAE